MAFLRDRSNLTPRVGPGIIVVMNGVKTGETDRAHAPRGNISLQWAQGVVKFRKVEIKPL